jgi:hypothetical protein
LAINKLPDRTEKFLKGFSANRHFNNQFNQHTNVIIRPKGDHLSDCDSSFLASATVCGEKVSKLSSIFHFLPSDHR